MKTQIKYHRSRPSGCSFSLSQPLGLLPDRIIPLKDIIKQFLSGRPVDQSLQKNLPYNNVEYNPLYQKGVDLCDLPKITQEVGSTLQEATDAIEQAKISKGVSQVSNPATEPPEKVES